MTTRGPRLLLVFGLAAGLLSLGTVMSPASAVGSYTSWSLRDDPGNNIVQGGDQVYDAGISVVGDAHYLQVAVDDWFLDIEGPGSSLPLVAGQTYTGVPQFSTGGGPGLSLHNFRFAVCSQSTSTLTVRELTTSPDGHVAAFNATFEFHCANSSLATRGSIAYNSSIPPVLLPPKLSLSVRHHMLRYGVPAFADVRLSADAPSHDVALYLQPVGQPEMLITHASVVGNGWNRITFSPPVSGVVTARWSGNGQFPDLAATASIEVSAKIKNRLRGSTGQAGGLHLVPASRDAILYSQVVPNHQGDCLRFHVQYKPRGRWAYDSYVKCVHLDKRSVAAVRYRGNRRLIGLPIRIRAEFKGDELNTKWKGKWQSFRFIGGRSAAVRARLLEQPERLRPHPVQARQLLQILG